MSLGRVIRIHPAAPPKPPEGALCNGCGVCCVLEPCPLGVLWSGRRRGACVAVQWDDAAHQYRCGILVAPAGALTLVLPRWLRGASPLGAALLARVAPRWIAAGTGCDSSVEVDGAGPRERANHRAGADG